MTNIACIPEGLCPAAVKVARRLQTLPTGQGCGIMYALILVKEAGGDWRLTVLNPVGRKVEEAGK